MLREPTEQEKCEFAQKVLPIVLDLCQQQDQFGKGKDVTCSRGMNLVMGADPKTKKEQAFAETAQRRLSDQFPGDLYPRLAKAPPPLQGPNLRVVG